MADSILGAVQESPVADVCRIDMDSYAAPVPVCRALRTDGFYPSRPQKNCEALYPEDMPVFYNMGIFTATAVAMNIGLALFMNVVKLIGTAVAQWLRCCATNRKVAGSIPAGVIRIFHRHKILPIALWPWGLLSL